MLQRRNSHQLTGLCISDCGVISRGVDEIGAQIQAALLASVARGRQGGVKIETIKESEITCAKLALAV